MPIHILEMRIVVFNGVTRGEGFGKCGALGEANELRCEQTLARGRASKDR